jgi:hypothetical protein
LIRPVLLYRRVRYGYSFCRIRLTQGKFALVDPDDYFRLSRHKWFAAKSRSIFYAVRSSKKGGKRYRLHMHRDVLKAADDRFVDHINGNGLDNRKANLRPATVAQNAWNADSRRGRSGYKGVCFDKKKGLWRADIACCGKRKYLGCFPDNREAARAYDRAAIKYHGEFASLNFPDLTTNEHEQTRN